MGRHWIPRTLILSALLSPGLLFMAAPAHAARDFGTDPLQDVKDAALAANRCSGLTRYELSAMVLSVTWPETGAASNAPSPMTLARHDFDSDLNSPWNNTPRDYWHAGIGAWQLDEGGLGANKAAFQVINTKSASTIVADSMAADYCGSSGTSSQRRAVAFSPWFACGGGTCEGIYDDIYCSGSDTVCHVDTVNAVSSKGGMKLRSCLFNAGPPPHETFDCWFIDPDNAQGWTSSWQGAPKSGDSGITPLSFGFYNYWDGAGYEFRHWLEDDTGYGRGEVWANRHRGDNPRSSGALDWTDIDVLCDLDTGKGHCP